MYAVVTFYILGYSTRARLFNGTSTLGALLSKELPHSHLDTDDYFVSFFGSFALSLVRHAAANVIVNPSN